MKYVAIVMMLNGAFGVTPPMDYLQCVTFIYRIQTEDNTKKTVQSASCMSIHQDRNMTFYLPLHPSMK